MNRNKVYTLELICYTHIVITDYEIKGGGNMTEKEVMQKNIEEFVQLQSYMLLAEKESEVYKAMKVRYNTLKVILTSSGINLTDIDRIKE